MPDSGRIVGNPYLGIISGLPVAGGTIAKMPELATSSLCQFTSQTPSGSSSLASSGPRVVPYLFLSTHRIFWEADLFKPMLWDFSDIGSRWHRQRDK